jgi:hypothetical protein
VKCASCSAEIADKAIVCYRCGAPTAAPAPVRRAAAPAGRGRLIVLLVVLVAAIALLVFTYLRRAG